MSVTTNFVVHTSQLQVRNVIEQVGYNHFIHRNQCHPISWMDSQDYETDEEDQCDVYQENCDDLEMYDEEGININYYANYQNEYENMYENEYDDEETMEEKIRRRQEEEEREALWEEEMYYQEEEEDEEYNEDYERRGGR